MTVAPLDPAMYMLPPVVGLRLDVNTLIGFCAAPPVDKQQQHSHVRWLLLLTARNQFQHIRLLQHTKDGRDTRSHGFKAHADNSTMVALYDRQKRTMHGGVRLAAVAVDLSPALLPSREVTAIMMVRDVTCHTRSLCLRSLEGTACWVPARVAPVYATLRRGMRS